MDNTDYRDRRLILSGIGVLLLCVGIGCALLGPAEMYCFYLFAGEGRFAYEGFGFGSFMFGNIAAQIVGYYLIGALCIPLGYGHIRVRRWARTLSLTALWFWLIVGIPLSVIVLFVLVTAKEPSIAGALVAVALLALGYLVIPGALIRFYRSRDVRRTFEARDPRSYWIERVPLPVLVLCALFLFYIAVLHVAILFGGIFPLFGGLLYDLEGILALDVSIWCLALLTWGLARQEPWAWWGALVCVGILTVCTIWAFSVSSYLGILSHMHFAPTEVEALDGIPMQGYYLAAFFGLPLLATVGLTVYARRYFSH
jgi:uncharacterized membrane protein YidH (DUF202 family)